ASPSAVPPPSVGLTVPPTVGSPSARPSSPPHAATPSRPLSTSPLAASRPSTSPRAASRPSPSRPRAASRPAASGQDVGEVFARLTAVEPVARRLDPQRPQEGHVGQAEVAVGHALVHAGIDRPAGPP